MLRAWLGIVLVAVAARGLHVGSVVDLGLANGGRAAAVIALGLGLGALARRVPSVFDAVALAIALIARGTLASGSLAVFGTAATGTSIALVASLLVPAVLLGRFAAPWIRGRVVPVLLGWATGEALVLFGGPPSGPVFVTAPVLAALVFALTRGIGDEETQPEPDADEPSTATPATSAGVVAALPLGAAVTLALLVLRRVMPGYASPTVHADAEWVVALVVPAAVVALFVAVLVGDGASTAARVARLVGGGLLGLVLVFVVYDASIRYEVNGHIAITRQLREEARAWSDALPWLDAWDLWVTSFVGYLSLGLGVASGALRGRAFATFSLGAALAFAAETTVVQGDPVHGPAWLMLVSAGLALWSAVIGLVGPWGLLAAPIAAAPLWLRGEIYRVGYDAMRRPGELSAEAHVRSVSLETQLFSSPGGGTTSPEGTATYLQTSIGREPMFPVYETAFEAFDAKVQRMEEATREGLDRFYGVRYAGVTAHPGHPALGDDGAVGRMLRMFATPGDALVVGLGAELVGLDLATTEASDDVLVVTPSVDRDVERFGDFLLVLADVTDTDGLPSPPRANVATTLVDVDADARSFDLVVVAPERPEWPGAGASLTRERLAAAADTLAPGGRCLAWIDTMSLDAPSLRARLAAFGAVFGARSLALLEPRGQDAPFVVAVGWVDDAGAPRDVLAGDATRGVELSGLRSTIRDRRELAEHLLLDGDGLARLADDAPVHAADRFVATNRFARHGWAAVAEVYDGEARWVGGDPRPTGAPDAMPALFESLVLHGAYSLHLEFVNETVLMNLGDIDWDAYDAEVEQLAEAARTEPDHPLVHHAAASLGERLVVNAEFTRFGNLYEQLDAEAMRSWRLELLKAAALDGLREPELAADALDVARDLAGLEPLR